MKELFYVGKETNTGKKVLVSKNDFDSLSKEKAVQSLLDMGVEITNNTEVRDVPDEPEFGTKEYFDQYDCWDAIGGDWEG